MNEVAPIIVGAARLLGTYVVGKALDSVFSSSPKPASQEPPKTPTEPPTVPFSLAGVSSLGKFKKSGIRKSSRNATRKIAENAKTLSEATDIPRAVEHHIMRDTNIKQKILLPIYNLLKHLKSKNKYNSSVAAKHLYYVVNYAIRDLNTGDKKITLSQLEKARVVKDLIRNFEKSFR